MNELALFAGVGGGILASQRLGHRIVCAVERDPYCREVLLRRQEDNCLPVFPIWDDVDTFDGHPWHGLVDVISAGFPCQPFSVAGDQRGTKDERNKWPATARIISEVRPRVVILENVPPVIQHLGDVLTGDLARLGYDQEWGVVSARQAGARHLRKRWWLVAHAKRF